MFAHSQTLSLITFGPMRLTLSTAKNLGVLKQDGVPLDPYGPLWTKRRWQHSISRWGTFWNSPVLALVNVQFTNVYDIYKVEMSKSPNNYKIHMIKRQLFGATWKRFTDYGTMGDQLFWAGLIRQPSAFPSLLDSDSIHIASYCNNSQSQMFYNYLNCNYIAPSNGPIILSSQVYSVKAYILGGRLHPWLLALDGKATPTSETSVETLTGRSITLVF